MRMPLNVRTIALAAAFFAALCQPAFAQRDFFSDDRQPQRNIAGGFDYYALVLSWSPTHCSSSAGEDDDLQCNRRDGKRYSFVLHGLWPQYDRGWPQNCRTGRRPFVPQQLIDSMLDIMPSDKLVIHEYRKHGTCSGLDPASYFRLSRILFRSIKIPDRYVNPFETLYVSPDKLRQDIARLNPNLDADSIAVACAGGGGGRLREIRICFAKDGKSQACGTNENPRKLCSASELTVPPVRSTTTSESVPPREQRSSPLPGPKVIPFNGE